jgi:transposase
LKVITASGNGFPANIGYWKITLTLARFCRVRSYLVTARNHGVSAIDAIHAALTGKPWLPVPAHI